MKTNSFQGDLTDILAAKEPLVLTYALNLNVLSLGWAINFIQRSWRTVHQYETSLQATHGGQSTNHYATMLGIISFTMQPWSGHIFQYSAMLGIISFTMQPWSGPVLLFSQNYKFWDNMIQAMLFKIMKTNIYQGDLSDISVKKKPLPSIISFTKRPVLQFSKSNQIIVSYFSP